MTRRYTGGFLSAKEQATDSNTANGVFTLQEAQEKTALGNFPTSRWIPQASLKLRSGASAYLSKTYASAGNRTSWTFSAWMKYGDPTIGFLMCAGSGTGIGVDVERMSIVNGGNGWYWQRALIQTSTAYQGGTNALFKDPSAWYHLVCVWDSNNTQQPQRWRVYVNGVQLTRQYGDTAVSSGQQSLINSTAPWKIGRSDDQSSSYADCYLAEINFIDGQSLDPSYFGTTDPVTGTWIPKKYSGTYGTNGFYLVPTTGNLAYDQSGNGNNWVVNNMNLSGSSADFGITDVPGIASVISQPDIGGIQRGNYPTFSPLSNNGNTISNGNLTIAGSGSSYKGTVCSMALPSTGKFYWEFKTGTTGDVLFAGIGAASYVTTPSALSNNTGNDASKPTAGIYSNTSGGKKVYVNTGNSTGITSTDGDLWMFAYEADTGKFYNGINGVWYSAPGGVTTAGGSNPAAGTGALNIVLPNPGDYLIPYAFTYNTTGGTYNFGQQPFVYTPPAGFKSLCNSTLPVPPIKRPEQHFDTKLYSGSGNSLLVGTSSKETQSYQIPNSLRFRGSTAYRSPLLWRGYSTSGTGGAQKWTYSVWVKKGHMSSEKGVLLWGSTNAAGTNSDSTNTGFLFETNGTLAVEGQNTNWMITSASFNDKNNWHHLVLACDTTQPGITERLKLYVDGVRINSFSSYNALTQNQTTGFGLANNIHQIGSRYSQQDLPFDGFMAEANFIDGQQLTPTSFGQFDALNNWFPIKYTGTYGTNGWYLPFTPPTLSNAGTQTYAAGFDGSTQYLTTPSSTNLALGTGAFTIEFWMNLRADSNNNLPIICQDYVSGIDIRTGEGGSNQLGFYINSTYYYGFYPAAWRETWQHVALVRTAGGALTMYVGGSPILNATNSANCTAQQFRIGQLISGSVTGTGLFNGSISNVRVVKGTAVYTSQFTPPTGPLTAISGTQLLALTSSTVTADASSNNFTLTNTGSVSAVVSYPMAKNVGVDASGNGNDLNTSYNIVTPMPSVLTYGVPGTYTWTAPAGVTSVQALVIGGGGGGADNGGGGGAGGMVYNASYSVTPGQSYTVTVGSGGRGGSSSSNLPQNGKNSVFATITAYGGGSGSQQGYVAAGNGGSGGGGSYNYTTGGTGTAGQGNNGGTGSYGNGGNTYYGAGGGGAGGAGYNGGDSRGGPGLANSITGTLKYYAGGGGGNYFITNSPTWAVGGIGGGGSSNTGVYTMGAANTGGGGGTRGGNNGYWSTGGSGVVILSYTNANSYTGAGANILDSGDIFVDTPTEYDGSTDGVDIGGVVRGSYAKFNNHIRLYAALPTVTNGGLTVYSNAADYQHTVADMALTTGKWYWEYTVQGSGSSGDYAGIVDALEIPYLTSNDTVNGGNTSSIRGFQITPGGQVTNYGIGYGGSSYNPSPSLYWESGDVIQFALDVDNRLMYIGKNGTWIQSQVPSTGTNGFKFMGSGTYYPFIAPYDHPSLGTYGVTANFGQKQFVYTPPTGFKSINTKNLKAVGSYNLPDSFGNVINTPDLVWTKARTGGAVSPRLYDTVRGPGWMLGTNGTGANYAETNPGVTAFLPNGFQLYSPNGAAPYGLENGYNYVAWCWNRGQLPGFDIVNYAGSGATSAQSIPHNLGAKPKFIVAKVLNTTNGWLVYHSSAGATQSGILNGTNAFTSQSDWNSTEPTSSTFTVYGSNNNTAGNSYIAYLWAEVPGFSKIGSYTGNGSASGPFVYTGFRPRFVLIKRTDSVGYSWFMYDTARDTYNPVQHSIYAESSAVETAASNQIDFLSNGFRPVDTNTGTNGSGGTFAYVAFAENPFKYSTAR